MYIFTPDYLSTIISPSEHFERGISSLIATDDYFKPLRERLEQVIQHVSDYGKRQHFIDGIRSKSDITCLSAISEVIVFDHLRREFDNIKIEEPLEQVNGKTPDFWVNDNFAVEVATIFTQESVVEYEILETLNKIRKNIKLMLVMDLSYWKKEIPLKPRILKKKIEELLIYYSGIKELTPFSLRLDNGILLRGTLYRGSVDNPTVGSVIHSYGFRDDDIDYRKIARKRIVEKSKKYKALTIKGHPLIIVLYNRVSWLVGQDPWIEILIGEESNKFNPDSTGVQRNGGILTKDKNTSISAILVNDLLNDGEFLYFRNPYARVPISKELDERIYNAFSAKKIFLDSA